MARRNGIFGTLPQMARPLVGIGLGSDWTWKNTTANSEVQAFQRSLHGFLRQHGYYEIAEDGKLGPGTCGAWLHLMNTVDGIGNDPAFPGFPSDNWGSVCQAWTYPTKVGGSTPETNPITKAEGDEATLPWKTYSDATVAAQNQINQHLVGHDMNALVADGKMGAGTCGAMRWLDTNHGSTFLVNYGKNCESFTEPTRKTTSQAPVATPVVIPTTPTDPGGVVLVPNVPTTSKPKVSTAAMVTGVAALGVVGGLAWWYSKKKGLVANRSRRRRRRSR